MRGDDLSGIRESLDLQSRILSKEAENAFLTRGVANEATIYPAEREAVTSGHKITVISGANQCLRGDSQVLHPDGTTTAIRHIEVGDPVVAFDFATGTFQPSRVTAVFENGAWTVHRFFHDYGVLECTRSHKVCVFQKNKKYRMMRVLRACKQQQLVVVRDKNGNPALSTIYYQGPILSEPTWDIGIDHPDHAFVCDGVVVSNSGKALPNSEVVVTPTGYAQMGDIKVGDLVCTPDGGQAPVTGVYPQGERDVWEITFSDRTTCRCDLDHIWRVRHAYRGAESRHPGWADLTLRQILAIGGETPSTYRIYAVPESQAEFAPAEPLPLDPYALGLLLGDGTMGYGGVGFSTSEVELVDYLREKLPVNHCRNVKSRPLDWYFSNGPQGSKKPNDLINILRSLGLMGHHCRDLFIPGIYKMASREDRIAILQGLMDADGTADKFGHASYCSISERLAGDVAWVLRSLGERCTISSKDKYCTYKGEKKHTLAWEVYIGKSTLPLFRLERKTERLGAPGRRKPRRMVKFRMVGREDCTCIMVDHPDHMFMTRDFIPTHNTLTCAHRAAWDATGLYPDWYDGPRTQRGIDAWVIGDTGLNVRDSYQKKLFGPDPDRPGWTDRPGDEALISAKYIMAKPSRQSQPPGLFDTVRVKHVPSDTTSIITQKSHQMDQQALASWTGDRVFIDEECPLGILNEMIARILVRSGQIFISMCPLNKYPDFLNFIYTAPHDLVKLVYLGHDQVKHLTQADKDAFARLYASSPAELAARTKGILISNTGLIYPFPIKDIIYDPAKVHIPSHAVYLGGMDVGWTHPTAAAAIALDKLSDTAYCYATYAQSQKPYAYHHAQLLSWGDNMTFMIDTASDQSSQADGVSVLNRYLELAHPGKIEYDGATHYRWEDIEENKRKYIKAERAFQVSMDSLWHRFETGKMRINQNLRELLTQYNNYTWNKDGTGPRPETPAVPLDIITALRLGSYHLPEYAHPLTNAPWERFEDIGGYVEPPEDWVRFKCGRE